jgi:hypothetical protein
MEYLYRPSEESPRERGAIYAAHYYIKHYREGINGRAGKENYRGGEAPRYRGVICRKKGIKHAAAPP